MTFDEAFKIVIGHEGGYTLGKGDPGGETKYGISKSAYPKENIKAMTLERAKAIYRRDYWDAAQCDRLPDLVRFDVFDAAVNSGVRQAAKWLQEAVGTVPDGVIGPKTLDAVNKTSLVYLVAGYNSRRLHFMTNLSTWDRFGKGWARRIADNLGRSELVKA